MITPAPPMAVGDRVRFQTPATEIRRWWDVRATDERYTILTRQAEFEPKGTLRYTIIDRVRDVRGPCNLIGQGWGWGIYDDAECASLLRALQRHDLPREELDALHDAWEKNLREEYPHAVEVSYRNRVPVRIREIVAGR